MNEHPVSTTYTHAYVFFLSFSGKQMDTGTCARASMHKTEMQINPQIASASV